MAVLVLYAWLFAIGRTTHGFVAYFTAARLLLAGELGPQIYDDTWFGAEVQRQSQSSVLEIYGPNPPTMALLVLPVAALDHSAARAIWILTSLALLAIGTVVLLRMAPDRGLGVVLAALLLLSPSVFANLATGQAYLALFALFVGLTVALLTRRDTTAGVLLGLALAVKSSGAPLLLFLIVKRRWRAVTATAATLAALAGAVLITSGLGIWTRYPAYVLEFLWRPASGVTAYQTTRGFVQHVCLGDPRSAPLLACPSFAPWVSVVTLTIAAGFTLWATRRTRDELWIAAAIALSVLVLPIAEDTQFVLLGIPIALLLSFAAPARPRWFLALFAVLCCVPATWTIERFTSGWLSVLAYPRLFAAWFLWTMVVMMAVFRPKSLR